MSTPALPESLMGYLTQYEKALAPLPATARQDALAELRAHLHEALAQGRDADGLLAGLGTPEAMAQARVATHWEVLDPPRSAGALAWLVVGAAFKPFAITFVLVLILLQSNTYFIWWSALHDQSPHLHTGAMLKLAALLLPFDALQALPAAAFFLGLMGLPKLSQHFSQARFRSLLPRLALGALLLGLSGSALALALSEGPVRVANRAAVDLSREGMGMAAHATDATRSAQELGLMELGRRMTATEGNQEDAQVDLKVWHLKLAIPFTVLTATLLGFALGLAFASKPLSPAWAIALGMACFLGFVFVSVAWDALRAGVGMALAVWAPQALVLGVLAIVLPAQVLGMHREPPGTHP